MSPIATAWAQSLPIGIARPAMAAAVSPTCRLPSPSSRRRMSQSVRARSSSPTRNSISTTPNSA